MSLADALGKSPNNPVMNHHGNAALITQDIRDSVDAYLSESTENRLKVAETSDTTYEDKRNILICLSMRMTNVQTLAYVNSIRVARGDRPLVINISRYKNAYGEVIDEIYGILATRIGEIYRFADKVVRIGVLNDLADALQSGIMREFTSDIADEMTIKKGNLFVKVLDRINGEMGGKTLMDSMIRRLPSEEDEHTKKNNELTKSDIIAAVQQNLEERYKGQLPQAISDKVSFTDYTNCANGEQVADQYICWSPTLTNGRKSCQCLVQVGEIQRCKKFLNKALLDNKDWLEQARKNGLTVKKIAGVCGCLEYDTDIRERVAHFVHKYNLYWHEKEESDGEKQTSGQDSSEAN